MSQDRIIESRANRIRVIAGPGTGKTWCIQNRMKALLEDDPTCGERTFAVTFTKNAASQLKNELTGINIEGAGDIRASTLHSYAYQLISREDAIRALGRDPRPLFKFETAPFRHDVKHLFENANNVQRLMNDKDSMWARMQEDEIGIPQNDEDRRFNQEYLDWMVFHKCFTIGELISLSIAFMRNNAYNIARDEFDRIIVDEYQDLNKADQTLIDLIGNDLDLMIVGDDDQSIYSFRNAHPDGIRSWYNDQETDDKEDISLQECRRCEENIISIANSLIGHNQNRVGYEMRPLNENRGLGNIYNIQWRTRDQEINGIAEVIRSYIERNIVPEGESILVLTPRKDYCRFLKARLNDLGIDDVTTGSLINIESGPISEKISYLILKEDINDLVSLRYLLGYGSPDFRTVAYQKIMDFCQANDTNPLVVLNTPDIYSQLRIPSIVNRYQEIQRTLQEMEELNNIELLDYLFPHDGETLEFRNYIDTYLENNEINEEFTIRKLLIESLLTQSMDIPDAKIKVLTYHGAKGLTSHTVIVSSLINGILPTNPNPDHAGMRILEEERRLLYVSLTRAKHNLILSNFRRIRGTEASRLHIDLAGSRRWLTTQSSRFLNEMGPTLPVSIEGEEFIRSLL